MNREQVICPCLDVTAGQIMDAYEEGATTVDAIKEITGAGSVCGACIDEIETVLNELTETREHLCFEKILPCHINKLRKVSKK